MIELLLIIIGVELFFIWMHLWGINKGIDEQLLRSKMMKP